MSFTKNYIKNILFFVTLIFCNQYSKASDSLKVKKIEYFEEGKLVKAVYFDSLDKISKQFFIDYKENFTAKAKNEIQLVKFKDGKHYCFENYFVNIYGDSVFFYNPEISGIQEYIIYNSKGQYIETSWIFLRQKWSFYQRAIPIDSIEFVSEINTDFNFRILYHYDSLGNQVNRISLNHGKENKIENIKYDGTERIIEYESKNKNLNEYINVKYSYFGNITTKIVEKFIKRELKEKTIEKVVENDKKQELLKEIYQIPLKKSKPIGEPKLTFTQENIYENNRIIKIIYTDHILNKTKIHELKYEFY